MAENPPYGSDFIKLSTRHSLIGGRLTFAFFGRANLVNQALQPDDAFAEFSERGVDIFTLDFQLFHLFAELLQHHARLRPLAVIQRIEIKDLANVGQRQSKALEADNYRQPCAVPV